MMNDVTSEIGRIRRKGKMYENHNFRNQNVPPQMFKIWPFWRFGHFGVLVIAFWTSMFRTF
jgi:hypothetical protein